MNRFVLASLLVCAASPVAWAASPRPESWFLAYDSLAAPKGWLRAVLPKFEASCGCRVKVTTAGDAAQVLTRLELDAERGKMSENVVLGLDQNLWSRAKARFERWGAWNPKGFDAVPEDLRVGAAGEGFLPFDFGVFAFVWDSKRGRELKLDPPQSLTALLDARYARQLILEDPRTSTPGLGFVLYVDSERGAGVRQYWKSLQPQWLTLAPGWDAAYGLFLQGEAPLVWSYVSSQAYHREHGDQEGRYRALVFEEGNPVQIEGAGLVKDAPGGEELRALSKRFLEFLISPEAQSELPRKQWMMPVNPSVALPDSFKALPVPSRRLRPDRSAGAGKALRLWVESVSGAAAR